MAKIYASRDSAISPRELRNMARARNIAAEGMVLLENDGTLPLKADGRKLAVFGSGARRTIQGGTGSGEVNSRSVVNVEQGLEDAGFVVTTKNWLTRYDDACAAGRAAYIARFRQMIAEKGMAGILDALNNPYRDPDEPEILPEDMEGAEKDLAVYVIARISGEGADRKLAPGDYELSEIERRNLETLTAAYKKTVVVLNVGGVIDTKFLRAQKGIGAILLMSQPGNISGLALADVLTGRVTPSGHLTATWAEDYKDYPCAESFSYLNGDTDDEYYNEGIFVGYRWFDSFGKTPAYPFGYGRSYTRFSIQPDAVELCGAELAVAATVQNTGTVFSGRETVQVYVSQPQSGLDKPYQVLAGFAKSGTLAPGEKQTLAVRFPLERLASYDESRAAWILDGGDYVVRVGSHSRNTQIAAVLKLDETVILEQLENKLQPDAKLNLCKADPASFYSCPEEAAQRKNAPVLEISPAVLPRRRAEYGAAPAEITTDKQRLVTMAELLNGSASLDDLVAQLSVPELAELCVGSSRGGFGSSSTIGAASAACPGAAGDTTSLLLESRGVMNLVLADGPAGLRLSRSFVTDRDNNVIRGLGESALGSLDGLFDREIPERPADAIDYYQYCTAIPIATMLAQTWDMELIEQAGDIVGEEMEQFGVTLWLAPGMNIHRNPLCGRNFEYYSEDPLLAGFCAAADTRGVQAHPGCGTTIKHFALNNLEDNRTHSNSHCAERAIREIYLKGFEIAVKTAAPLSLMSSYNLLNGEHTANKKELLTDILRDEWGYQGLVMSDWDTTGAGDMNSHEPTKYGYSDPVLCIKNGNDLIMPGSQQDLDAIIASVGDRLSLAELQRCARRVLALVELRERALSK